MPLAVVFSGWKNCFHTLKTFLCVNFVFKHDDVFGLAEVFNFAVFSFALDFYAVIHHAAEDAGAAVNAQVLSDSDFATFPVQCVSWASFDA